MNVKKKKNRKEYYRIYKQNVRQQNSLFKAKELAFSRNLSRMQDKIAITKQKNWLFSTFLSRMQDKIAITKQKNW